MSIAAAVFRSWLVDSVPGAPSIETALSEIPEFTATAVRAQVHKNAVSEKVVVYIARKYGLSPVEELASFDELNYLRSAVAPGHRDRLIQLPYLFLLNELMRRSPAGSFGRPIEMTLAESDVPDPLAFRSWFANLDPANDLVQKISKSKQLPGAMGIYKRIRESNPTVPLVIEAARTAKRPAAPGLLAMGLLTPSEIGLSVETLAASAAQAPLESLIAIVEQRNRLVLRVAGAHSRQQRSLQNDFDYL